MSAASGSSPTDIRAALIESADWTVAVVIGIEDEQWQDPGLGEWDVRELTAHTSRGLSTIERYLDATDPGAVVELASPEAYYRAALTLPDVHRAVAERGRAEVGSLGDDPAATVATLRDEVLARVAATPVGAPCATIVGTMRLEDYLVTRVAELTLHTIDLATATGQPVTPPPRPARLVASTLLDLAPDDRLAPILAALSGRGALPAGFDVLGFGPDA